MFRARAGSPLKAGDTIVQPDLAKTFRLIATQGEDVFYKGEIAQAIVDAQKRLSPTKPIAGGRGPDDARRPRELARDGREAALARLRRRDSARTAAVDERWARPARDARPVPEGRAGELPGRLGRGARIAAVHTTIESMRLSFADRDMWIGDPDVADVPTAGLLSDGYLTARSSLIHLDSRNREREPAARRPAAVRRRGRRHGQLRARGARRATRPTSRSSTSGATASP